MHEINKPAATTYVCVWNPIINKLDIVEVTPVNLFTSGQPFILIASSESVLNDLVYTQGTARTIDWLTGYTLQEATEVIAQINSLDFIRINYIKHPNVDEYALPYNEHILMHIPDEQLRSAFMTTVTAKIASSNFRIKDGMIVDGWFPNE